MTTTDSPDRRRTAFRLLPVIDLKLGIAVHGRAGRRDEYQPVRSVLATDANPWSLARGIREQLGLEEIYLADLDAIAGAEPSWKILETLIGDGFRVWLDAGVAEAWQASRLLDRLGPRLQLIVGLETLASPHALTEMLAETGSDRLIVSLDLQQGEVRSPWPAWREAPAERVAEELTDLGARRLILLDIARVGMEQGTGTAALVRKLRAAENMSPGRLPRRELYCGGGIRSRDDLRQAAGDGCDGALVATALHSGLIRRDDLFS